MQIQQFEQLVFQYVGRTVQPFIRGRQYLI